jgi:hypothetical protein
LNKRKKEIITALGAVGEVLQVIGKNQGYEKVNKLVDEAFFNELERIIAFERNHNGWFTPEIIRRRFRDIAQMLDILALTAWSENYVFAEKPKCVGIIMAGNIPLVGFHDLISVLISGNKAVVKPASDDKNLLPQVVKIMELFYPDFAALIETQTNFKDIDAMLATGSDNSAKYFEKYFGHLPCLIRKNRTSLAVLDGTETKEELELLGSDIFDFYGLGCRNVSQLLVPENFDLDRFFGAIVGFEGVAENKKYANNYDYHKTIYLMNQVPLLENGFLLTKASDELFAPVAVLNIKRYKDAAEVEVFKSNYADKIQAVVGHGAIPFGKAQQPALSDYADGVDVVDFLTRNVR